MLTRRGLLSGLGAASAAALFAARIGAAPLVKVKAIGTLRVALYKDNRPWSWAEGGRILGIDAEIARAIAHKLGVSIDLAEISADESVDDDLRNAVWKGGLLGFQPADIMLHIPFDRTFASRNDQVAIIAPYYRENFQFACRRDEIDCDGSPAAWRGRKLAAELDSIPDFYLIGALGGSLSKDVVHYPTGWDAVSAMVQGSADGVLATRAQIDAGVKGQTLIDRRRMPLPAFTSAGWDIGMAVKENSRTLGDAVEEMVAAMAASGELKSIFAQQGVEWVNAKAAG